MVSTVDGNKATGKRRVDWTVRVSAPCKASAETVYDIVSDLRSHPIWNGPRKPGGTGMLTMDAPAGPARPGVEFHSTGQESEGRFSDRSVVTEADRPRLFEYVTNARAIGRSGRQTAALTSVYRYEFEATASGSTVTFKAHITEFAGEMLTMMAIPGLRQIAMWMLRRAIRRGLTGLVALAEHGGARG